MYEGCKSLLSAPFGSLVSLVCLFRVCVDPCLCDQLHETAVKADVAQYVR